MEPPVKPALPHVGVQTDFSSLVEAAQAANRAVATRRAQTGRA